MSTWHALITWSQCTAAQFFDQTLIAKCTQVNKISHIENKTICQIAILFEHRGFITTEGFSNVGGKNCLSFCHNKEKN